MNSIDISALPPPPPDRKGWPFTEGPAVAPPPLRRDGTPWPRITIVTPSYNQGRFLEETLRSVLLQGYPNLEYLVMDGGSQDQSVALLQRYAPFLGGWVSERDRGQAHALNNGFRRATGDIIAWLNSDDVYQPGALHCVAERLRPEEGVHVVFGDCYVTDEDGLRQPGTHVRHEPVVLTDWVRWWDRYPALQPAIFFSRAALEEARLPDGRFLDERLQFAFDYDLWLRLAARHTFQSIPAPLASFRRHHSSKSLRQYQRFLPEIQPLSQRHWGPVLSAGYLRNLLSSWIYVGAVGTAYHAVELSQQDRREAAQVLLGALLRCPIAPLVRPRPFLAGAYRIVRGWGPATHGHPAPPPAS